MGDSFRLHGMLLGASSAATQIEGGDKNNNWYDWYLKGHIRDGADPSVATLHWERWEEDARLMAEMGLQCCRLGLEWSRLEPQRGVFDESAYAHYRAELTLLQELGIRPMVTLWHFSNPLWFEEAGGFLGKGAQADFLAYVEHTARELGTLADCFITLNEPNVYAFNGYIAGDWPPGERNMLRAFRVMDALCRCHIAAYERLHALLPDARVTIANHLRVFDPKDARNPLHRLSAAASRWLFQGAIARVMYTGRAAFPLREVKPGKYYDYLAVNYYTRSTCDRPADGVREHCAKNDLGWEIYAEGLGRVVRALSARYPAPVYISENGTCDNTDSYRCRYIYDHLRALTRCGVKVERYYHWCFCDNFEWTEGVSARFGLVEVDYATQERRVKRSGEFYREIIKNNGVTQEMYDEYVAQQHYHVR